MLLLDLMKSRVLHESLSMLNQSSVWRMNILYYAITTEWKIYTNIERSWIFWQNIHYQRMQTKQGKDQSHNWDAKTNRSERPPDLPRHSTVSEQISPRITEPAEPLCDLTKEHAPYVWGPEHSQAFDDIKKEIIEVSILKYYYPKKATVLQTDASRKGLGACLL